MLFELDTEKLQPLKSRTNHFTHLAAYPETDYDISMLFDSGAAWTDIYDAVMGKKKASALLKEASFVDEYRGKQIPAGKKSVTIRLTIGSEEKTLTSRDRKRREPGDEEVGEKNGRTAANPVKSAKRGLENGSLAKGAITFHGGGDLAKCSANF